MAPLDDKKTSEMQVKGSEIQGSEIQGSGRTIFYLLKIVGDVIDDELQVSDAHKCAGKKVDPVKRALRVVESAGSRASVVQAKLGDAKTVGNTILETLGLTGGIAGITTFFTKLAKGGPSDADIIKAFFGGKDMDEAAEYDVELPE